MNLQQIRFDKNGLVPAIIRDVTGGEVLMLVWMNATAVERTLEAGQVHYYSRSRRQLRKKGETSGQVQTVREIRLDCDGDCLLISVEQTGGACHSGEFSCFHRSIEGEKLPASVSAPPDILALLYQVVRERRQQMDEGSYVASLYRKGLDKILAKIGEEATETAVAGKGGDPEEIVYESADLLFHLMILLGWYELPPERVYAELRRRFGTSGLEEKASRGK